jgi:hypothetical protein
MTTPLKLETYKIIDISKDELKKMLLKDKGPVIYALCKDMNYKNVGTFLIQKIVEYLKNNEYDKVYLIPGSVFGKINYFYFVKGEACKFYDYEKYYQSNMKLIKYYENIGFVISQNLYDIDKCEQDYVTKYHLFNVLIKKLD